MDLDAVAIEFNLVYPPRAGWDLVDRYRQLWFDEAGVRCLDADERWLFALERHGSSEAHRKRQLHVVVSSLIPIDESPKEKRNVAQLQIAAPAQFMGDVCRNV